MLASQPASDCERIEDFLFGLGQLLPAGGFPLFDADVFEVSKEADRSASFFALGPP